MPEENFVSVVWGVLQSQNDSSKSIIFQVFNPVRGLNRRYGYLWPEHPILKEKPSLDFAGEELKRVFLEIRWNWALLEQQSPATTPLLELNKLLALAATHDPLLFTKGPESMGTFVIENIEIDNQEDGQDGNPIDLEVRVAMKEWVEDPIIATQVVPQKEKKKKKTTAKKQESDFTIQENENSIIIEDKNSIPPGDILRRPE
jgi:phage protein U